MISPGTLDFAALAGALGPRNALAATGQNALLGCICKPTARRPRAWQSRLTKRGARVSEPPLRGFMTSMYSNDELGGSVA